MFVFVSVQTLIRLVPSVKCVAYSTCSIHVEENEQVVEKVLQENTDFELFKILPDWKERGDQRFKDICDFCVRTDPQKHQTRNGFFVCCFVRKTKKRKPETKQTKKKKKQKLR